MQLNPILDAVSDWLGRPNPDVGTVHLSEFAAALGTTSGLVRSSNEDRSVVVRYLSSNRKSQSFFALVVSDGMGGMKDGARCAELAVASFVVSLAVSQQPIRDRIFDGLSIANGEIFRRYKGAGGATLSAVIVDSTGKAFMAHVGDSRVCISIANTKAREFRQISRDDTLLERLRDIPAVAASDLAEFALTEGLAQYVGVGPAIQPQILALPIDNSGKQTLLLTSDGVHGPAGKLLPHLMQYAPSEKDLVQRLIALSRWLGGHDNASAIACTNLGAALSDMVGDKNERLEFWDSFGQFDILLDALPMGELMMDRTQSKTSPYQPRRSGSPKKRNLGVRRETASSDRKFAEGKRKPSKRTPTSKEVAQRELDITIVPGKSQRRDS